ncbi:MAG: helix-turn-helix transcriptional regulator [Candidatus Marinimicrobia bacterium]|nr:helix-turn-helix transcriptional regulator [Candidatus Neomarinimicrobiota bacterium]
MTDCTELLKILKFISAALLILFSVFFLNLKKGNRLSHRFLAIFFLSRASILLTMLFWEYDLVLKMPNLAYLSTPFLFLYAPMLFFYTDSVTRSDFRFTPVKLLHLIPFVVRGSILFFRYYRYDFDTKLVMLQTGAIYHPVISSPIWLYIQNGVYMVACFTLLYHYRQRIKDNFSALEKLRRDWLNYLLILFFIWKGIFISGYLYGIVDTDAGYTFFQIFIEFSFLIWVCLLIYKALEFPELFRTLPEVKKYQTSPLTDSLIQNYQQRIEICMRDEKLYLNPSLTLKDLAKEAGIPARYISQVLNESVRQKFYDYVNRYRIEESKRQLSDPASNGKTILAIIYDAGFNSKSVFHSAFKKHVGMTPCEYRLLQHS